MPLPKERSYYTIDDIYNLPEGQRAELIDGYFFNMAPPGRRHQDIIFSLGRKIADYIDYKRGSCKVYLAPFAVFLNEDNKNYVEPDISVICNLDQLNDRGCAGAPDWIIEVVSPGSKRLDYAIKLFKYRSAGVREYWIVDYEKNRILIYDFLSDHEEGMEEYTFTDSIRSTIFDDLVIDFKSVDV